MKEIIGSALGLSLLALFHSLPASAGEDLCNVPMDQWQAREALQTKLEGEGWKVKKIKTEDGCYEVYALKADGKRIEAHFDPKSFKMVKSEED